VKESNDFLVFKIYYQLGKNSRRAKTFSSWEETKFFLSGNFCTFETICYPNATQKYLYHMKALSINVFVSVAMAWYGQSLQSLVGNDLIGLEHQWRWCWVLRADAPAFLCYQ